MIKKSGASGAKENPGKKAAQPQPAEKVSIPEMVSHYLPLGIAAVNKNNIIEYINPKFTEMFGYTRRQVPDLQSWFDRAYPDRAVRNRMSLAWKQEMLRDSGPGSSREEASTVRCRNGSDMIVHIRTTTMDNGRHVLSFEDISERVRAEVLMLNGWNIYRNLVETVLDWTWEVKSSGVFTYSSPQVKNILGYTLGEVVGRNFSEFLFKKDVKKFNSMWRECVEKKKPISFEISCPTKSGSTIYLEASGTPLIDKAGKLIGFRGINRDITERKALEAELHSSHEKLRALTARLEDVREEERTHISRELHDELGQTLTGLKIDLTWVARRIPPEYPALAEKANAMKAHIDSIIEYIRRIATQLRPKLLDDFGFIEAIEWLISDFSERTNIRCKLRSNLTHMTIDPKASTILFRIIQETLTNIMRHSEASSVAIDIKKTAARLLLSVRDNGIGIKQEDIMGSRSLGLLGIRERVAILKGTIKFEGMPGKGTRIKISFPLSVLTGGESQTQ